MTPQRLSAKYAVTDPDAVDLPALIPVFHRWIQEHRVDGVLIDVADYKHVHQGPGIMLIGHEADYALDLDRGCPGLRYTCKRRHFDHLGEALRTVLHQALQSCLFLETEPTLSSRLTFRTDAVEITFLDRLRVPNQKASLERVRRDLDAVLTEIYGSAPVNLEWIDPDPRQAFAVRASLPDAVDVATLVSRLHPNPEAPYGYAR